MYAVVGCSECSALWVLEGRPETSQCPRCGQRRQFDARRKFVETADADAARQARAAMLAERQDLDEAFEGLDSYREMGERVREAGIDADQFLEAMGVDSEETAAAAERAGNGPSKSSSQRDVVREGLAQLEEPDEDTVLAYASERGVPAPDARQILEKLVRSGEVTVSDGRYRLL